MEKCGNFKRAWLPAGQPPLASLLKWLLFFLSHSSDQKEFLPVTGRKPCPLPFCNVIQNSHV
jgi:hypothetical protein